MKITFKSQSASTYPWERKAVVGGLVALTTVQKAVGGSRNTPPSISRDRGEITDVQITPKGALKSITVTYHKKGEKRYTPAALDKLIQAPIPNGKNPTGSSLRFVKVGSRADKAAATSDLDNVLKGLLTQQLKLNAQINSVQKQIADAKAKAAQKKTDVKDAKLAASGKFSVVATKPKFNKDYPTLARACAKTFDPGSKATIMYVANGKSTKVMVWSAKDPVTGNTFKGFNWRYASASAKNKFGPKK